MENENARRAEAGIRVMYLSARAEAGREMRPEDQTEGEAGEAVRRG